MDTLNLFKWVFDLLLVMGLLWLAWQALFGIEVGRKSGEEAGKETSEGLFRAIVLFIAFGLLMSLAWVRLGAPDVALAEASIGAGLTGALLLSSLARLNAKNQTDISNENDHEFKSHH